MQSLAEEGAAESECIESKQRNAKWNLGEGERKWLVRMAMKRLSARLHAERMQIRVFIFRTGVEGDPRERESRCERIWNGALATRGRSFAGVDFPLCLDCIRKQYQTKLS